MFEETEKKKNEMKTTNIANQTINYPRIMISATSSGSGKTLITCGFMQALKKREKKVTAFKCGPDYIDPMFHQKVLHTPSYNLDTFFTNQNTTKALFTQNANGADISVVEGVMGYFDGIGGTTELASAYEVSKWLDIPVILVVNAKGMSLSVVALIQGFLEFRKPNQIQGIILNQVSAMLYPRLKQVIEDELKVKVLGYVPRVEELVIESRHLGLVMPEELQDLEERIDKLAILLEESLEIDEILRLAHAVPTIESNEIIIPMLSHSPTIGVARDEAFCFYYADNLELIRKMGANIVEFSPLHDKHLPENIQGLLLGGGYPELYAKALSENESMLREIKEFVNKNRPVLAECGGFMYLHDSMEDKDGVCHPMVGAIQGRVYKTNKLNRFGYINLTSNEPQQLLKEKEELRGHEFHYWDSTNCGEAFVAKKPLQSRKWNCIHGNESQCMGFPHLHYYSNPSFLYEFLNQCVTVQS